MVLLTLAHAPGDWIQNPQDGGKTATDDEGLLNIATISLGVNSRLPYQLVNNVKEREASYALSAVR